MHIAYNIWDILNFFKYLFVYLKFKLNWASSIFLCELRQPYSQVTSGFCSKSIF